MQLTKFSSTESWVILSEIEQRIKAKIEAVGTPLKDWDINIYRGILTGYNEAFIINGEKRQEILANCETDEEREKTDQLIRPILRGRDIKKYGYDFADLWLINTHNGIKEKGIKRIYIEDYPAIKKYLDHFYPQLNKRADKGDTPYNLRNCAYIEDFFRQKIVWKRVGSLLRFSYDETGALALDSTCFATGEYIKYLVAVLNSKFGKYLLKDSPKTGTGDLLISVQAVEPLLIPIPDKELLLSIEIILDKIFDSIGNRTPYKDQEKEIDSLIYSLLGFSNQEIEVIEFQ